jgi:hypothetical protein
MVPIAAAPPPRKMASAAGDCRRSARATRACRPGRVLFGLGSGCSGQGRQRFGAARPGRPRRSAGRSAPHFPPAPLDRPSRRSGRGVARSSLLHWLSGCRAAWGT